MIRVAILGSTGSIGRSALEVIKRHPQRFKVVALAANRSLDLLAQQVSSQKVGKAVLVDEEELGRTDDLPAARWGGGRDALLELTHRSVDWARRNDWWMKLGKAFHRLQQEPGAAAATGRLLEVGRGWWKSIIDRGQVLGLVRTDLPLDRLMEIAMGADQGGDRWMMEHWDEFPEEGIKKIVDARVDLLRDMLDKENEGWDR